MNKLLLAAVAFALVAAVAVDADPAPHGPLRRRLNPQTADEGAGVVLEQDQAQPSSTSHLLGASDGSPTAAPTPAPTTKGFHIGREIVNWAFVVVGFVLGLFSLLVFSEGRDPIHLGANQQYNFPTEEMSSRATWQGILVGLAIAIPSGAGVGLSVLNHNTSSLVGVAISASLLPPAARS